MPFFNRVCAAAVAVGFLAAVPAGAVTFSDLATFQAATTTTLEDFDGEAGQNGATVTLPMFTATESGGINGVVTFQQGDFGGAFDFAIVSEDEALGYDDNGSSLLTFSGFASGTTAFGTFISANADATVTVSGSTSATFSLAANTPIFFGVTEAVELTSLIFDVTGSPIVGFDDVRIGTANEGVVPLPASLPLLIAGLAGLGYAGRRRR